MRAKSIGKATISARKYCAATGKWENLGVIYAYKKPNLISRVFNAIRKGVKRWLRF